MRCYHQEESRSARIRFEPCVALYGPGCLSCVARGVPRAFFRLGRPLWVKVGRSPVCAKDVRSTPTSGQRLRPVSVSAECHFRKSGPLLFFRMRQGPEKLTKELESFLVDPRSFAFTRAADIEGLDSA